jgi:hypothetical protein
MSSSGESIGAPGGAVRLGADPWQQRVDSGDWPAITAELDSYGGALLPQLLTPGEAEEIRGLYDQAGRFRSTINMGRHRFGEGEYRYFRTPYPEPVERLKQALYPRLLPIARDWHAKLGRPAPSTSGCECATTRARPSPPRSCSGTGRGTGTPCTATSTATSSSRFKSSST